MMHVRSRHPFSSAFFENRSPAVSAATTKTSSGAIHMNTLRAAFIATLLSSASAYADGGSHCMAAIGTRGAAQSTPSSAATAAAKNPMGLPASPDWSAFIGTGCAAELNAGTVSSAVAAARAQP